MRREFIAQRLELSLREALEAPRLRVLAVSGERPTSDEEREPWLPIKYGPAGPDDWFGVVPTSVRFERTAGATPESLDLVTKVNPSRGLARTLIPWIIEHRKIALDRPYREYRSAAESDHTSRREQQLYLRAESTPELRRLLSRCYGTAIDAARGEDAIFLEFITDAARLDASGALADWPPDHRRGIGCGGRLAGRVLGRSTGAGPMGGATDHHRRHDRRRSALAGPAR
jgi:hypothetical protein